jgi:hypothetical protein
MPVPSAITGISQTPGSNSPAGSESPALLDDYIRTVFAFIATLRDGQGLSNPVDLASAGTTDIGAQTSPVVRITGTTTITSFGTNYAGPRFLVFGGALTLTHNATSLILPGGANITTAAGDAAIALPNLSTPTGWRVVLFSRGAALPAVSGAVTSSNLTMSEARVLGRLSSGTGAIEELTTAQLSGLLSIRSPIFPIAASVDSNALTLTLNAAILDFRSSTLGSGAVNTRTVSSPVSLTISSGSTLGTVSGQASRIIVLALDNAGTVELAAVNLAGGVNLDETSLISTTAEGGAGGADSATTVYSTTARTSVPYRVLGFVDSTQATAGTWATAPSLISGAGGMVLGAMQSFGFGQDWQSVTRTAGVTYYNTTGKPIGIEAVINGASASCSTSISINGGPSFVFANAAAGTGPVSAAGMFTVPAWKSYVLSDLNVSARSTYELR